MKSLLSFLLSLFLFCPLSFAATGRKAMVATASSFASRAALEVLQSGGNAVDAAVAAQWVLNVVEPESSGIGGGGFFLYYEAITKRIYFFDGRETAPKDVFPEMFLDKNGEPIPFNPERISGGLPVGVPGVLKLLYQVHGRFGSKKFSFARLFDPAIEIAEKGFSITPRLVKHIEEEKSRLKMFPESRRLFLNAKGEAPAPGTVLKQPELAQTFRLIQTEGPPVFYQGRIAKAIVKTVREAPFHPGLMKIDDLLDYEVRERTPVHGQYRGYDIFSVEPPSSGGTTLIEALNILNLYKIKLYRHAADGIHLLCEAQKLSFQDRNRTIGDPDFVKVPVEKLLSPKFAIERAEKIHFDSAIPATEAPIPVSHTENPHTSHISIVDEAGNMAAFTTTIEQVFGSAMMVPGYGFFLNNELTDFEAIPRNEKNELVPDTVEPGKRPRSSMTPAFVFSAGKPFLILGSPGGSKIIGAVLNVIVNRIDFDMPLSEAISAPRVINRDGAIEMEKELFADTELKQDLMKRGHSIILTPAIGNVQAVEFEDDGTLDGESDPRGEGEAMGY